MRFIFGVVSCRVSDRVQVRAITRVADVVENMEAVAVRIRARHRRLIRGTVTVIQPRRVVGRGLKVYGGESRLQSVDGSNLLATGGFC
jgi:hypothetical protein